MEEEDDDDDYDDDDAEDDDDDEGENSGPRYSQNNPMTGSVLGVCTAPVRVQTRDSHIEWANEETLRS